MPPKAKAATASRPATATAATSNASAQPASKPNEQILPQKEAALFKSVLRYYEVKQYKKAIKNCDTILKRFPSHGETLAMKGLIYNALKKSADAHALVKKGLAANIQSHVCWHVYGLVYRSERKYEDAIKCYQNALRRDPNNLQILKDLSQLQVQLRSFEPFMETRRKILLQKTNNRNNWLAYVLGAHFSNLHTKALQILDSFLKTQSEEKDKDEIEKTITEDEDEQKRIQQLESDLVAIVKPSAVNFEESEIRTYRLQLLIDSANFSTALSYLLIAQSKILDRNFLKEKRAFLYERLGRWKEAEVVYRALIKMNNDCYAYHYGLQRTLGLREGSYEDHKHHFSSFAVKSTRSLPPSHPSLVALPDRYDQLLALYDDLAKSYPTSAVARRMPLSFLPGDHHSLRPLLAKYMKRAFIGGIPSLFTDLRPLYADETKRSLLASIIEDFISELRSSLHFEPNQTSEPESPLCLVWSLYFAAQHHDYTGKPSLALSTVNEAIAHTPTAIDLYVLRARIYKHAGASSLALHNMNLARQMDTADRYLNTKCVRYAFRARQRAESERLISLFLRDGDGLHSLQDLQVMWYELAQGAMYEDMGQFGKGLKQYKHVDSHFNDVYEDQFDFHTYCLRKCTLRAYVDCVGFEGRLRGHRFFVKACTGTVRTYVSMWDAAIAEEERKKFEETEDISEEERKKRDKERKKLLAKERKKAVAEEKKALEEAALKSKQDGKKAAASAETKDDDPDGEQLAALPPLVEASKWLAHLHAQASQDINTWIWSVRVYWRKQKWSLMWWAIKQGLSLNRDHPEFHWALCVFLVAIREKLSSGTFPSHLQQFFEEELKEGDFTSIEVAKFNDSYLSRFPSSINHRFAVVRVRSALSPNDDNVFSSLCDLDFTENCKLADVIEVYNWVVAKRANKYAELMFSKLKLAFPLSPAFGFEDVVPVSNGETTEKSA